MSVHQLPATMLSGAFAATAAVAWAAAGRRRGAPTIAGALLVLQGALHLLFSTAGHAATRHPRGTGHTMAGTHTMPGMPGMPGTGVLPAMDAMPSMGGMGAMPAMDAMDGMDAMVMATADPTGSGAGMLAVHVLAALLCGLWLARGEAAFFTLARAALAYAFTPLRLLRALVPVPGTPRRPVRRGRRNARRPHTVVLAHTLSRRGPPRLSVPRATALGAHV
ncbi:hypothetical protein ACFZCG_07865 [Streptomyces tanashiensis]|uniref:hypothetical protein n=1 Tax=Streptomyces tanashiensis TaxID=67367 RepID=UPI0036ED9E1E